MNDYYAKRAIQDTAQAATAQTRAKLVVDKADTLDYVPDLQDRVHVRLVRAQVATANAMKLAELEHLLAKHPDLARILDLIDQTA